MEFTPLKWIAAWLIALGIWMVNHFYELKMFILSSGALSVMYPVLHTKGKEVPEKFTESTAGKLFVAVMIQALTGTIAAVAAATITLTIHGHIIERQGEDLKATTERLLGHVISGGHKPLESRVDGLDRRVERLEDK